MTSTDEASIPATRTRDMTRAGFGIKARNFVLERMPSRSRERIEKSDTLRRFLKLVSWTTLTFALDKGAMLVVIFLLAHILGGADYGRLTLTQGLVNTAQIFVVMGAGTMLGRYIPAMREQSFQRAVEVINLCILVVLGAAAIFTLAGIFTAPTIATAILDLPASSPITYITIVWLLLTAINNLLLTIMLSFERGAVLGGVSLFAAILSVATIPLATLHFGLTGAVAAFAGIELAKALLLFLLYARHLHANGVRILTPARLADTPLLWRFGLPVFLTSVLWAPTIWLAQLIIKTRAPDGLVAVGAFGFANNLLGATILISSLTNRAAFPIQSSLHARGEHGKLRRMSWLMTLAQFGAAIAIALPISFAAPFIMAKAGDDFAPYWPVLIIVVITGVVIAGQTPLSNYLLVNQRPYFNTMTLFPWAVVLLLTTTAYASHGAYALAWGLLAASILRSTLFYWGWFNTHIPNSDMKIQEP